MSKANSTLRIAIAGCGPAGLSAAIALHRDGHRIELFDQLDTPAPIGSGLLIQPTGLAVLEELGLREALEQKGNRIDRLRGLAVPSGRIALDVNYKTLAHAPHAVAVHRGTLFDVLFDAVRACAIPVHTGFRVTRVSGDQNNGWQLHTQGGHSTTPVDFVIDALGVNSPLAGGLPKPLDFGALWATLNWPDDERFNPTWLEQRYQRARIMVGVLPIGRTRGELQRKVTFFWSLKRDAYEAWCKQDLSKWKKEVLSIWPQTDCLLEQIHSHEQLVFASYAHRTLAKPHTRGLIHIGDAAHSTSPQLGQGANMALLDTAALQVALAQTGEPQKAGLLYANLRRRHVRAYQAMSLAFTPAFQSDGWLLPTLRDFGFSPVNRIPGVRRLLACVVAGLIVKPMR